MASARLGGCEVNAARGHRRSSDGCWIPRSDLPSVWSTEWQRNLIAAVEDRIALATGIPLHNEEPSQILRYTRGAEYSLHPDFFDPQTAARWPTLRHADRLPLLGAGRRRRCHLLSEGAATCAAFYRRRALVAQHRSRWPCRSPQRACERACAVPCREVGALEVAESASLHRGLPWLPAGALVA